MRFFSVMLTYFIHFDSVVAAQSHISRHNYCRECWSPTEWIFCWIDGNETHTPKWTVYPKFQIVFFSFFFPNRIPHFPVMFTVQRWVALFLFQHFILGQWILIDWNRRNFRSITANVRSIYSFIPWFGLRNSEFGIRCDARCISNNAFLKTSPFKSHSVY